MRVVISHPYAITENEGLDRAVIGLAQGLHAEGIETSFVSLQITPHNLSIFKKLGDVHFQELRNTQPSVYELGRRVISDIFLGDTSRRLLNLFKSLPRKKDTVLITAQEFGFGALIEAAKEELFDVTGWWAFGTPHLYPSNRSLRDYLDRYANAGLDLVSIFSPILNRHFWKLRNLDFILAGSEWLGHLLNYFGGFDCAGVVYPPTDTEKFHPSAERGSYVFAIGDAKDIRPSIIAKIANHVPVIKAGSFQIAGARNVGFVPDEKLISLYSSAAFMIFPQRLEQFGLPVAESLACGTPVLTFAWQGPGELIIEGVTGWKAYDPSQFFDKTITLFKDGYDPSIREKCRRFAEERLSIQASTRQFLSILDRFVNS